MIDAELVGGGHKAVLTTTGQTIQDDSYLSFTVTRGRTYTGGSAVSITQKSLPFLQ